MRFGDCRHLIPGVGVVGTCAVGIDVPSTRRTLTAEQQGAIARLGGPGFAVAWPCHQSGRFVAGLTCASCSPVSAEEVAAAEAGWRRVFDAIDAGRCPTCDGPLVVSRSRSGRTSWTCNEHGVVQAGCSR